MTYIVTEACIKCKYTDCVEVCPVDCIVTGVEESKDVLMARYQKIVAAA